MNSALFKMQSSVKGQNPNSRDETNSNSLLSCSLPRPGVSIWIRNVDLILFFASSNFVLLCSMIAPGLFVHCRSRLVILQSNLQCFGIMRKDDLTEKLDYANCLKCEGFFPSSVCI